MAATASSLAQLVLSFQMQALGVVSGRLIVGDQHEVLVLRSQSHVKRNRKTCSRGAAEGRKPDGVPSGKRRRQAFSRALKIFGVGRLVGHQERFAYEPFSFEGEPNVWEINPRKAGAG